MTAPETYEDLKARVLEDPDARRAYDRAGFAMEFGDFVREQRKQLGLTQAQLAEALETQQPAISRLEAGVHAPTIDLLTRIGDVLDMRITVTGQVTGHVVELAIGDLRRQADEERIHRWATVVPIDRLPGVDDDAASCLRNYGISTSRSLLQQAATRAGRRQIAMTTGIDEGQILFWVNRADLMRVKGIGTEYSDLLETAGVDTVRELRRRNPKNLVARLHEVNKARQVVRRVPTEGMVARWVIRANALAPLLKY